MHCSVMPSCQLIQLSCAQIGVYVFVTYIMYTIMLKQSHHYNCLMQCIVRAVVLVCLNYFARNGLSMYLSNFAKTWLWRALWLRKHIYLCRLQRQIDDDDERGSPFSAFSSINWTDFENIGLFEDYLEQDYSEDSLAKFLLREMLASLPRYTHYAPSTFTVYCVCLHCTRSRALSSVHHFSNNLKTTHYFFSHKEKR